MTFLKSLLAAIYSFRVSLMLTAKKMSMDAADYPALLPFMRQCRLSQLSPSECVFMIGELTAAVDLTFSPSDERWKTSRNGILEASLRIWDETITMVRPRS
jgi:ribosome-associated toxin RatA of RatAB toxin-antitoxin module